jgi:hypothetical protein
MPAERIHEDGKNPAHSNLAYQAPLSCPHKYETPPSLPKEVNRMKKLSVRKLETVKTTAALYGAGCSGGGVVPRLQ